MRARPYISLIFAVSFWTIPACTFAQDKTRSQKTEHMVAMSDGTKLATDVYLPVGKGPFPVVLVRTPYDKSGMALSAPGMLAKGYAFVCQDFRGRFKSKGNHWIIFHNEGWGKRHDGQDTIRWVADQPWCNGSIASWGGSALGIAQNMTAPGAPDALKAQFVHVAFSNMYAQGAYQGGAFRKGLFEGWLNATGMTEVNLATFVAHPRYDSFWEELNPEAQAGRVKAPAVFMGGWYDIFLQGTINSFLAMQKNGAASARGKCRLVVAPIGHGAILEMKYPPNAGRIPKCAEALNWFDYILKGEANGIADEKPVHYYVMGDPTDAKAPGNEWRHADTWPPPAEPTSFYFHPEGKLLAGEKPDGDGTKSYKYDPLHPVMTVGGQELGFDIGPKDQRKVESRPDVLLFSTDVLKEPVEVTGRITAKLYVSSDCPDTDFTVKLTDVYPNGRSMLVTDGILRTRFRKSFTREEFMEPGKIYEVEVDLWSTSLVFNKGHQIRVAVSSSNAPRFDPNPNTGHPLRADKETRIATNTLHFSHKYPSRLILPLYKDAHTTK